MNPVPQHVSIIMDGNGRWAQQRGLPRTEGHQAGAKQITEVLNAARELGIKTVTLYAFSTENWKRSPAEVAALMNLLGDFLDEKLPEMMANNIRLRTIGRTDDLFAPSRKKLLDVIKKTKDNRDFTLNLALSYGGRAEIVDAVNHLLKDPKRKNNGKITEHDFSRYLYAPDLPDPELMIRTAGEYRLSNFLLWQLAYAEFYVTETLWPDFGRADLRAAVEAYQRRDRRFGGVKTK